MSLLDGDEEPTTKRFNHTSTDYGKWVEYNGYRFKDLYSIETKDGVVFPLARPNGDGWYLQREVACTREEYDALPKDAEVPYKELPESIYYEAARGRIDDKDVARIALVPDEKLPFNGYDYTGKPRIIHNRRMFAGYLSPEEDNTLLGPTKATVKYFSFQTAATEKTSDLFRRYSGPTLLENRDFVKQPDGSFTYEGSQVVDIIPEYFQASDRFLRVLFQRGWRLRGTLDFKSSVKEIDSLAPFTSQLRNVTVVKQGRTDDPATVIAQLEALEIKGVLHFSFYYD